MAKLDAGEYDALILAAAGLERLGMSDRIHQILPKEISLHAVGQGALGIECRADDSELISLLKAIEHPANTRSLSCRKSIFTGFRRRLSSTYWCKYRN